MQTLTPTAVRLNNLSGSVEDLDDSPDAPDGRWCLRLGTLAGAAEPSAGVLRTVGLSPSVSFTNPFTVAPSVGTVRAVGQTPTLGGSSYTASHYVAPFASVSGASNDYDDLGATSWTNATSSSTPTTLGTAMARATSSNGIGGLAAKVQCAAGEYVGNATFSGQWVATFSPANSGTSGNPIVFFAEYPAATNVGSPPLYSEIRRSVLTYPDADFGPAISTIDCDYVILDGFYIDESVTRSGASAGAVQIAGGTGCEARRILVDRTGIGSYETWAGATGYNGNSIYVSHTINARVRDCYFFADSNASTDQNEGCIEVYNSENLIVEYNTCLDAGPGIFVKTEKPALLPWEMINVHVRYNKVRGYRGIQVQTAQSAFVYFNEISATEQCIRWASTVEDISVQVQIYNNTCIKDATNTAEGGLALQGGMTVASGSEIKDNLMVASGSGNGYLTTMSDGGDISASVNLIDRFNYNFYYATDGTPRWLNLSSHTSLGAYQDSCASTFDADAYGREVEQDSQYGSVTFQEGSYKLESNGQAALTASSTGGPVGCYVTGNEEIGVRANPTY